MGSYTQPGGQKVEKMNDIKGFIRKNGSAGIRNHVLVLPTVSCVNGVVNRIGKEVPEAVCVPHAHGCGRGGARDIEILFRILSGLVHHPNVGGVVLIGLGCEVSSTKGLLPWINDAGKPIEVFNVQTDGGSIETARKGIAAARRMLAEIGSQTRVPVSWDKMMIAMECGGSDAMSGITANVAIGAVSDWLVKQGATVIFGENTEMIGTTQVLTRRAKNEQVAGQIEQMVAHAEKLTQDVMGELASLVISPGNMDGGMSTIAEKSMGSIVKGGLQQSIRSLIMVKRRPNMALSFRTDRAMMVIPWPGLPPAALNSCSFPPCRGNPFGFPAMPVIKVASNTRIYKAMQDDMDVNAGVLAEGEPLDQLRDQMIDLMIRVINGENSKAEANGMDVLTFMTVYPPF